MKSLFLFLAFLAVPMALAHTDEKIKLQPSSIQFSFTESCQGVETGLTVTIFFTFEGEDASNIMELAQMAAVLATQEYIEMFLGRYPNKEYCKAVLEDDFAVALSWVYEETLIEEIEEIKVVNLVWIQRIGDEFQVNRQIHNNLDI